MVWFKVDDGFAFHPKALAAGNAALGLWVRAGSWCGNNLTDGALPANMIGTFGAQKRDARRLVSAGLWCETSTGYQFIDWHQWQPTKEQVKAERAATKKRVQEYRERRSNAVTTTVTNGVSNGAPTRPDPTRPVLPTEVPPTAKKPSVSSRATRLPEDWEPSLDLIGWVRENCPNVDGRAQTARFRDYWISKAGQGATKVDWPATYRNWMREAQERAPGRPPERAGQAGMSTGTQRAMAAVNAAQQIKDARSQQLQIGAS